jgi:hypothetical protein
MVILVMGVLLSNVRFDRPGLPISPSQDRAEIHEEGDHIPKIREGRHFGRSFIA